MSEYEFSLARILPDKDRIEDFALIRECTGQRTPVFRHILCGDKFKSNEISGNLFSY